MTTFTGLTSVPPDPVVPFTDQLRLAVAADLAASQALKAQSVIGAIAAARIAVFGAVAASMLRSAPAAQICAFMWRPLVIRAGQLVSRAADHR